MINNKWIRWLNNLVSITMSIIYSAIGIWLIIQVVDLLTIDATSSFWGIFVMFKMFVIPIVILCIGICFYEVSLNINSIRNISEKYIGYMIVIEFIIMYLSKQITNSITFLIGFQGIYQVITITVIVYRIGLLIYMNLRKTNK
ncbi:MAG: hypothetical protein ACK5LC_17185 [Coprobacillaceae bacterium]